MITFGNLFWGIVSVTTPTFCLIAAYNHFVTLRNKVDEAYATMDVCLKKRFDLVPRMAEAVRGYARHEAQTLEDITKMRVADTDLKMRMKQEAGISMTLKNVVLAVENYPNLKASENFLELQRELSHIEDEIASSRRYYNGSVRLFNNAVLTFPGNCLASLYGFKKREMFVADEESRQNTIHHDSLG